MGSDGVVYCASDWLDVWFIPYKAAIEREEEDKVCLRFERDFLDKVFLEVLFVRLILIPFSIGAVVSLVMFNWQRGRKSSS